MRGSCHTSAITIEKDQRAMDRKSVQIGDMLEIRKASFRHHRQGWEQAVKDKQQT